MAEILHVNLSINFEKMISEDSFLMIFCNIQDLFLAEYSSVSLSITAYSRGSSSCASQQGTIHKCAANTVNRMKSSSLDETK